MKKLASICGLCGHFLSHEILKFKYKIKQQTHNWSRRNILFQKHVFLSIFNSSSGGPFQPVKPYMESHAVLLSLLLLLLVLGFNSNDHNPGKNKYSLIIKGCLKKVLKQP